MIFLANSHYIVSSETTNYLSDISETITCIIIFLTYNYDLVKQKFKSFSSKMLIFCLILCIELFVSRRLL